MGDSRWQHAPVSATPVTSLAGLEYIHSLHTHCAKQLVADVNTDRTQTVDHLSDQLA